MMARDCFAIRTADDTVERLAWTLPLDEYRRERAAIQGRHVAYWMRRGGFPRDWDGAAIYREAREAGRWALRVLGRD